jgi:RNA-directed DNA polymerase
MYALVMEPIFEADFQPSSYGFRPRRRAQDAVAEIHLLGSNPRNYEWVFEADITAPLLVRTRSHAAARKAGS